MAKSGRIVLLILLIGVMIAALLLLREQLSSKPEAAKLEVGAIVLEDPTQCQVTVRIDRPENDVELSMTVSAPPGIHFAETGRSDVKKTVGGIQPAGVRIHTFDCSLDGTPLHSGGYVVKTVVNHLKANGTEGDEYASGTTRLFVELQQDNTNIFLQDQARFDALFTEPYVSGAYYSYRLDLQPEETRPSAGLLHIRIDSKEDGFSPALSVGVKGGVRFLSPTYAGFIRRVDDTNVRIQAQGINSSGSRIVTIPISMLPDANPGSYGIKVLQVGRGEDPGEMAPLYIVVRTSPDAPGQKWLVPDKRDDAPLLTPAPAPK